MMHKVSSWVGTNETVDGGSKHLHGINEGVRFANQGHTLAISMLDASIVYVGVLTLILTMSQ